MNKGRFDLRGLLRPLRRSHRGATAASSDGWTVEREAHSDMVHLRFASRPGRADHTSVVLSDDEARALARHLRRAARARRGREPVAFVPTPLLALPVDAVTGYLRAQHLDVVVVDASSYARLDETSMGAEWRVVSTSPPPEDPIEPGSTVTVVVER